MKNKINIKNGEVNLDLDNNVVVSILDNENFLDVLKLDITVKSKTDIDIVCENDVDTKLDIKIDILENVDLVINEIRCDEKIKVQYKYNICENSNVCVNKFYNCKEVRELDLVSLNGINSSIDYNFKTIANAYQKYDVYFYHNAKDTKSKINNKGVTLGSGNITFNVSSIVYKGIKNCNVDQINKIINMNDEKNIIKPILVIDEEDVVANHSAYIGKFDSELLFYMESRGIEKKDAINLLIKGFLKDERSKVNEIIDEYWG